jgi:hypothetical protein
MSDDLWRRLEVALAERAGSLPPDASARLTAKDYRPRSPLTRPALALAGATVACVAVITTSFVGLGTDAPQAFAGWSATPTAPVGAQARDAERACRSRLPTSARTERAQQTASGPHRHIPWPVPRGLPPVDGGWC